MAKKAVVIGGVVLVLAFSATLAYFLSVAKHSEEIKVYKVGILSVSGSFVQIKDGFVNKMTELGYIEGKNIIYENLEVPQTATPAEAQAIAKKLVDSNVDLIFAFPTPPTIAAHDATQGTTIPVVFAMSSLEGLGLINSVREPGGYITGVRYPGPEMISKRLEILAEIAPSVKRVWIGYDKNHPNTAPALETLRPTALSLGITLVEVPAATLEELSADLSARATLDNLDIDAIITMNDGLNQGPAGYAMLNKFAADHSIPLAGGVFSTVEQGAILGNSPDLTNVGELAVSSADKILKGAQAGAIPVITPEQELYFNYKVAQKLGLNIPEGLLSQASEIIR
jgi:putative tryptophan/tyrosine transport system substrate-binding protein